MVHALTAALAVVLIPAGAATAETISAGALLAQLTVAEESPVAYSRELFDDWSDADGDGCDTRSEVLQSESSVAVGYGSGCTVATGRWVSPYDGASWTDAADVDVDHTVPLAGAWRSGAHAWTAAQRAGYANDLDFAPALQAVTDELNQSKSDRDPAEWLPPLESSRCQYAVDWVSVKWRWSLTVHPAEAAALGSLLSGACGATTVTVDRAIAPVVLPPDPAPTDRITAGTELVAGQQIVSTSGSHRLVMQGDGNAVVYSATGAAVWSSGTHRNPGAYLALQGDGNLVVYSSAGRALWFNNQRGTQVGLVMQGDGNLVQYSSTGKAMWWTKRAVPPVPSAPSGGQVKAGETLRPGQVVTSTRGRYRLVMQGDGNLVAYASDGRVQWSSRTPGNPGARLVLQSDGNAVVYAATGRALWHAGVNGRGGNRITIQDDGNLVLYTAANRAIWNTGPYRPPATPAGPTPRPASPDLDCPQFSSRREAQVTFDHWMALGLGDVHRLDGDNDGQACERYFG